eukprot:1575809-Amphidinium_carterae.1
MWGYSGRISQPVCRPLDSGSSFRRSWRPLRNLLRALLRTSCSSRTEAASKHPAEPTHRKCGCGISGETTKLAYPLPGCWQSVYNAELHAIMIACERLQGQGVVVTDCKGAAVVANKLKLLGLRKPRGRHSRVEHRIQAAIGDIEVQWMRSHQTAQQAEAAGLPATYLTGNAEADLLAGQAVQDVPPLPSELGFFRRAAAAARSFW